MKYEDFFEKFAGRWDAFYLSPAERSEAISNAAFSCDTETKIVIAMEECGELIQQLSKMYRGNDNLVQLIEEMADVLIMIGEIATIFDIDKRAILKAIDIKLNREKSKF